ncbi:MAG TPA: RnfH family protein [Chromatiaceae bacterium]|jgi:putative ubiquitin-RnfH superfamily antitoxin RatB of RatAB toxin-antitoxin module|nr:MAG: protein RnfH [Thiohalocapsa sp. PB-PSB1]QQO54259.1 MAG: RnfH family protein [Thiohalocapsa sp. PB-PSB1]HBG95843.1 RnfH family protein [Chromatiaceae bacterium]HCS90878.1 RnfH family protein [Chromatiaceae bacterium]
MHIGVAYADKFKRTWLKLDVPDSSTVREAIERSGLLKQYPEIDLDNQRVGIFGKFAKLDAPIKEGDRVEIYRPITADPETVPRRDQDDSS